MQLFVNIDIEVYPENKNAQKLNIGYSLQCLLRQKKKKSNPTGPLYIINILMQTEIRMPKKQKTFITVGVKRAKVSTALFCQSSK